MSDREPTVRKPAVVTLEQQQAKLNRRLRGIGRGYTVRNLKCLPSGEYWFDLASAFDAEDMTEVNRAFAAVLWNQPRRGGYDRA